MGVTFSVCAWRKSGFQDGRHAGQAELAERAIELDEIHSGSPVLRSMRSR